MSGRTWIAALTLLFAASAEAQQRAKYVTPDFGNAYTFTYPATSQLGVLVPVTTEKDVVFGNLKAGVTAVALGNVIDAGKHFKAELLSLEGATPQIRITTNETALAPGVYTVTIEIAQKTAVKELPQRLPLQLTMPAAEIKAPNAQTIDLVRYCFRCPADTYPVLHLQESGNRVGLTAEVRQNDKMTATDGTVIDATIHSVRPIPIKRNRVGDIPLIIDNEANLPLGKSSTTVAITSNELAASIQVPYEIRVRLAPWLLLPAILGGVAFGFVLRVLLKRLIERDTALVSAYNLLQTIKTAAGRERDAVFKKSIDETKGDVVDALTGEAATITAAVTAAKAALEEAKKDLAKRVDEFATGIAQMESLANGADRFTLPFADALRRAAQRLPSVRAKLAQRDAAAGSAELAGVKADLASDVKAAAADWAGEMQITLNRIRQLPPLPALYADPLKTAVEQLTQKVGAIAGQSLEATLDAIHDAQFLALHSIERPIFRPLVDYGERVAQKLPNGDTIEKAAQALGESLAEDEPHPLTASAEALETLLQEMRDVIAASAPDDLRNAINKLLAVGKYVEAAASIGAGEVIEETDIGQGAVPMMAPEAGGAEPWRVGVGRAGGPAIEDWASSARSSRLSLAIAKALNSVGIATLLALAGFAFLLPTFDGTLRGLLTAFFWGYASDFSADAITTAAKQVK